MLNKTLNVPSAMVAARMKSCEIVLSALETHAPQMADVLGSKYSLHLDEGQVMPFDTQLQLFEKELIGLRDRLHKADRSNRTQKAQETESRARRDADVKQVNAKVIRVRRVFSGVYEDDQLAKIGLARRNARESDVLQEQAAYLADNLEQSLELTGSQLGQFEVDPSIMAQVLKPSADQLRQSLSELHHEERQTEATQIAKNEAMEEFNHGFLWIARSVESLLQLAGLEEQAARVRPSSRRPGVTERLETSGTDGDEPVAEGDTPEAAGEAPAVEDDSDQPVAGDPSPEADTVTASEAS